MESLTSSRRITPNRAPATRRTSFFDKEIISPLLGKDGGTVATSCDPHEQEVGAGTETTANTSHANSTPAQLISSMLVLLISAVGVAAYIQCFVLLPAPAVIVYVAGGMYFVNFLTVICKEKVILFSPSRAEIVDQLQHIAKQLKSEAHILEGVIKSLLVYVSRFGEAELRLNEVVTTQGWSIPEFVDLVRENEEMIDSMKDNVRQRVVQDVIELAFGSDKGTNQTFDIVEIKLLALKITVKLEAYDILLDEEKFIQAVNRNPTMLGVVRTIKRLLPLDDDWDLSPASQSDVIYDMFYMSREDQQQLI